VNLTVVIPSRNRAAKLSAGLAALEKQSVTGFRVVVVDDGSTLEQQEQYKKLVAASALRIQLIHQPNKGIAGATNTGIAAAGEGLIVLMDDDILPSATHLEQHLNRHHEYPGAVICGTAETAPQANSGKLNAYKIYMEDAWSRNAFGSRTGLIRLSPECFTVSAANMSFTSETYTQLGPFDEVLRDCQDFEFGLRALKKNVPLYFDRHIRAIHNDEFTLTYFARRQRSYQLHSVKVLEHYPEYKSNFNIQAPPTALLKRLIYSLLRRKSVVRFIEHSALFQLLPEAMRFRIYGSTLAALSFADDAA
jgi:GT2 family glycosyltransferase